MMGEACPLPGIGVFQTKLSGSFQATGALGSLIVPSPSWPRQAGQSSAQPSWLDPRTNKAKHALGSHFFMSAKLSVRASASSLFQALAQVWLKKENPALTPVLLFRL